MVLPSRENQDGRVTLECARDHFGTFNPKPDTVVFDSRERRLRNTGTVGKLILTKALQFAENAH